MEWLSSVLEVDEASDGVSEELSCNAACEVPGVPGEGAGEPKPFLKLADHRFHDLASGTLTGGGFRGRARGHVLTQRCLQLDVTLPQTPPQFPVEISLVTKKNTGDPVQDILKTLPIIDVGSRHAPRRDHPLIVDQEMPLEAVVPLLLRGAVSCRRLPSEQPAATGTSEPAEADGEGINDMNRGRCAGGESVSEEGASVIA